MPPTMPEGNEPWYAEGLKFQCTGCGDCCTGAPGYVWVNQAEIDALAAVSYTHLTLPTILRV